MLRFLFVLLPYGEKKSKAKRDRQIEILNNVVEERY